MSVTSMQEARRSRGRRTAAAAGVDLAAFVTSWQLALEAAGKSPRTVRSYTDSVRALQRFLLAQGMTADVEEVDAEHLRAFLLAEERRTSATSAAVHFRNLRVFFGWLAREGERANPNPMDRIDRPKITKQAKPFFEDEELAALLKTGEGASFRDRRDTAIMRILIDTGMRVSGLANLRYDPAKDAANDVFLTQRRLRIRLKGGDETWVPIGKKAASALDRYLRARARHPEASSPWLWLGHQGHNRAHMTDSGDRKSTRLNSSHMSISYAVFCLKKKKYKLRRNPHCHIDFHFCLQIYSYISFYMMRVHFHFFSLSGNALKPTAISASRC